LTQNFKKAISISTWSVFLYFKRQSHIHYLVCLCVCTVCVKDFGLHNKNIDMIILFASLVGLLDSSPVEKKAQSFKTAWCVIVCAPQHSFMRSTILGTLCMCVRERERGKEKKSEDCQSVRESGADHVHKGKKH
jgi:hypothetical protein